MKDTLVKTFIIFFILSIILIFPKDISAQDNNTIAILTANRTKTIPEVEVVFDVSDSGPYENIVNYIINFFQRCLLKSDADFFLHNPQ